MRTDIFTVCVFVWFFCMGYLLAAFFRRPPR